MTKATPVSLRLDAKQVRPFGLGRGASVRDLAALGIHLPTRPLSTLRAAYGMDAAPTATITSASAGVPVQYLQHMLPGTVRTVTAARKIDQLVGRTIAGQWHDEEIIQPIVELTGRARPHGDHAPAPLTAYNLGFERRSIVRFDADVEVRILEEAQAAEVRQNAGELKRKAASEALAIEQNRIGFYGYADGEARIYGLLNDPNLPGYETAPQGTGGTSRWADKTFVEITGDLASAASLLRIQSGEKIDPESDACVLVLATSIREYLNVVNDHGKSVRAWLRETYPNWRIESAPEFDFAAGGQSIFYLFAEKIPGLGEEPETKTIEQFVPAVLRLLGVEKKARGVYEAWSNAVAGVMCRAPYAVVRFVGV